MLEGLLTILQTLFGWLLYLIFSWTLSIVDLLEKMFNVFAGTQTVNYEGEARYLLEIFIGNSAITNIFWAMALIGIVLSFGFTIVAVARKVTDVTGTTKHTVGQILSQFFKSLLIIVMLNMIVVLSFNVTSVVFDRINFALDNANSLADGYERTYTDEEFAVMTRVLATVGNYSVNPSAESRYNVNACFNAIRGELSTLYLAGCFDYDFNQPNGDTWQSALAQVVKAADLTKDLQLDTYYAPVSDSIINIFDNLKYNPNFKPQKTAVRGKSAGSADTATLIFLVSSMGAEENEQFLNGNLDDALRRSYISGEKDYRNFSHVFADFAITRINYLVGIIVAGGMLYCFIKTIIMFVVRMINLIVLYVTSPLFASSMSLDEGSRFQGWVSSFVMQLVATFGCVVAMRIYLLMVPIVFSSEMNLFGDSNVSGFAAALNLEYTAYLFFLLGGAWAVSKANTLIVGVLSNNAASSVLEADSMAGGVAGKLTGAYAKAYYGLPKWGVHKAAGAIADKLTGKKENGGKDGGKDGSGGSSGSGSDPLPQKAANDNTSEVAGSIPAPPPMHQFKVGPKNQINPFSLTLTNRKPTVPYKPPANTNNQNQKTTTNTTGTTTNNTTFTRNRNTTNPQQPRQQVGFSSQATQVHQASQVTYVQQPAQVNRNIGRNQVNNEGNDNNNEG